MPSCIHTCMLIICICVLHTCICALLGLAVLHFGLPMELRPAQDVCSAVGSSTAPSSEPRRPAGGGGGVGGQHLGERLRPGLARSGKTEPVYVYTYVCVYIYICVCIHMCTHHTIIRVYTHIYIYIYATLHTRRCMYKYMYTHICIYTFAYVYGYTSGSKHNLIYYGMLCILCDSFMKVNSMINASQQNMRDNMAWLSSLEAK